MNCRDADRLIDCFFDGELDGRLMREAALHITRCTKCESQLQDRERVQALVTDSLNAEIDELDPGMIWAGVERELNRPRIANLRSRLVPRRLAALWESPDHAALVPISLAGLATLAATVVISFTMLAQDPRLDTGQDTRSDPWTATNRRAGLSLQATGVVEPESIARSPVNQVHIESMDYDGKSVAMWSEPESDTMVIWIDDEEPATGAR